MARSSDIFDRLYRNKRHELLTALIENSSDAIIVRDIEGNIYLWNRGASVMYGYTSSEVRSMNISRIMPYGTHKETERALEKLKKSPSGTVSLETSRITKDGRTLDALVTMTILHAAGDEDLLVAATERDITYINRSFQDLKNSRSRLSHVLKAADIGNWDWNIQSGQIYWSEQVIAIFGLKENEFRGNFEDFIEKVHPDDRKVIIESINNCMYGDDEYSVEHRVIMPGGAEKWVMEKGDVLREDNGRAVRMIGIVMDITPRKRAEEILRRDKEEKELEVLEKDRQIETIQEELAVSRRMADIGAMAAVIAHELRNPLGTIKASVFNLNRKISASGYEKYFERINRKIIESDRIIDNLLFYTRLKPPEQEEVDMRSMFKECLDTARTEYPRVKAVIRKNYSTKKAIKIEADPIQIRELLSKIINNAYESFGAAENIIEIGIEKKDGLCEVIVRDNGKGIEEKNLDKVFEPFYSLKSRGTGLGLAICRQIARLHEGSIDIYSKRGKGTEVRILFPVSRTVDG